MGALDRRVSLHVRDISLRDALDRISGGCAHPTLLRFGSDPAGQQICAAFDSIPLGNALGLFCAELQFSPLRRGRARRARTSETPGATSPSVSHVFSTASSSRAVDRGSGPQSHMSAMNTVSGQRPLACSRYAGVRNLGRRTLERTSGAGYGVSPRSDIAGHGIRELFSRQLHRTAFTEDLC